MKRLNKLIASVVLVAFIWNTAVQDYALALAPESGFTQPGFKERVYAVGQKEIATHDLGPGSSIAAKIDGILSRGFIGDVPAVEGMKFVTSNYVDGMPDGWDNNPILNGQAFNGDTPNLIDAFKYFRNNEARLKEEQLEIVEGDFKLEKYSEGQLPICRIEQDKETMRYRLVIHKNFVRMWDDIIRNDVWFEYKFPDGKVRTVSLAWAIFYRVAKHEMSDIVSRDGKYKFTAKSHGHMEYTEPFSEWSDSLTVHDKKGDELEANKIGGGYAIVNDGLWMWFLGSYCFGPATQKSDVMFKDRALWFLGLYQGPHAEEWNRWSVEHNLPDEFPNLHDTDARAEAIGIARAINKRFYTNYRRYEGPVSPKSDAKMAADFIARQPRILKVLPATGTGSVSEQSPADAIIIINDHLLQYVTEGTLTTSIYLDEGYTPYYSKYSGFEAPSDNRHSALDTVKRDLQGLVEKGTLEERGGSYKLTTYGRYMTSLAASAYSKASFPENRLPASIALMKHGLASDALVGYIAATAGWIKFRGQAVSALFREGRRDDKVKIYMGGDSEESKEMTVADAASYLKSCNRKEGALAVGAMLDSGIEPDKQAEYLKSALDERDNNGPKVGLIIRVPAAVVLARNGLARPEDIDFLRNIFQNAGDLGFRIQACQGLLLSGNAEGVKYQELKTYLEGFASSQKAGDELFRVLACAALADVLVKEGLVRKSVEAPSASAGKITNINEAIYRSRLDNYIADKKALDELLKDAENNWKDKAQEILDVKNKVSFALEELWMESEVTAPSIDIFKGDNSTVVNGIKEGDLVCNHKTKETYIFSDMMESRVIREIGDTVVLRPLSLTVEQRKTRDEHIAKLRSGDRDVAGRMIALKGLKSMVESGILPKPFEVGDMFQHCHSTYSHSPGNTPSFIAWRGYVLGLKVTGIVDHDTVAGFKEFRQAAVILGLRNPTCGYEQRIMPKGTPFEDMTTNSPGNKGETYVAFHAAARDNHRMQEERVVPSKVRRFKKTAELINEIAGLGLDYDKHIAPLTEAGNPTEKHVAEAIARLIYEKFSTDIAKNEWLNIIETTKTLIRGCGLKARMSNEAIDKLVIDNDNIAAKVKDLTKFTFLIRDRVVTIAKQAPGYTPDNDEVIRDVEVYEDAHLNDEFVDYCYLGDLKKCQAEDRAVMAPEAKQTFIDNMQKKGKSLPEFIINWWLAKEDASMLHLWLAYQMQMGIDGIALMPNRDRPQEVEDVIKLAQEVADFMKTVVAIRFNHIANGMDVNTPDMPFEYFTYSNRQEFVDVSLAIVAHEEANRRVIAAAAGTDLQTAAPKSPAQLPATRDDGPVTPGMDFAADREKPLEDHLTEEGGATATRPDPQITVDLLARALGEAPVEPGIFLPGDRGPMVVPTRTVQGYGVWKIGDEKGKIEVTNFGAAVISMKDGKESDLLWHEANGQKLSADDGNAVRGGMPWMGLWTSRIKDGKLTINGRTFDANKFPYIRKASGKHPLHGMFDKMKWETIKADATHVVMIARPRDVAIDIGETDIKTLADIFGDVEIRMTYRMQNGVFTADVEVENLSATKPASISFGHHPFFKLGETTEDLKDWVIKVPGSKYWKADAEQVPEMNAAVTVDGTPFDMRKGIPLDKYIEVGLTDLEADADGYITCTLNNTKTGEKITVRFDKKLYKSVVIWVPYDKGKPVPEGIVAIEPTTSPANGHNMESAGIEGAQTVHIAPGIGNKVLASWTLTRTQTKIEKVEAVPEKAGTDLHTAAPKSPAQLPAAEHENVSVASPELRDPAEYISNLLNVAKYVLNLLKEYGAEMSMEETSDSKINGMRFVITIRNKDNKNEGVRFIIGKDGQRIRLQTDILALDDDRISWRLWAFSPADDGAKAEEEAKKMVSGILSTIKGWGGRNPSADSEEPYNAPSASHAYLKEVAEVKGRIGLLAERIDARELRIYMDIKFYNLPYLRDGTPLMEKSWAEAVAAKEALDASPHRDNFLRSNEFDTLDVNVKNWITGVMTLKDAVRITRDKMNIKSSLPRTAARLADASETQAKSILEVIDEYALNAAKDIGPGSLEPSNLVNEIASFYPAINMLESERVEVYFPQNLNDSLTRSVTEEVKRINKIIKDRARDHQGRADTEDPIKIIPYSSENLEKCLKRKADGVRRIFVNDLTMTAEFRRLTGSEGGLDLLRGNRVFTAAVLKGRGEDENTVNQAWLLKVALLSALLEEGNILTIGASLRDELTGRISDDPVKFMENLAKKEGDAVSREAVRVRISYFLGTIVKLSTIIGEQLRILKAFWIAA